MMDTDFSFDRVVARAYRGWWLVVIFTLLGGLLGFAISALRPALYEAQVEYTFSIDFARTGFLTDVEEDQAFEAMSDVIFSSEVLAEVVRAAQSEGLPVDLAALQGSITKERTLNTWTFRVRYSDLDGAVRLAGLWGQAAARALDAAAAAALEAGSLQQYLDSLEICLSQVTASEPVQAYCNQANLAEIQAEIAASGKNITAARQQSRGILPGMNYQWTREAASARRVNAGRGLLVLAGAGIGLLAAVLILEMGLLERRPGQPRHA